MENMESENPFIQEINSIRKDGSLENTSRILSLLRENRDHEIQRAALQLLSDIKDPKIIDLMIGALKSGENQTIRQQILRACWESGLNYSAHLNYFTDLFLSLDLEEGLEAYSLVETTILDYNPDQHVKDEITTKIKTVILDLPEIKQILAMDLIHMLT